MGKRGVKMTREELVAIRIELLKKMNDYIINVIGDEEIWMKWIAVGVPDEATEDDYKFMASDDDIWRDTCKVFGELVKAGDE